MRIIILVSMFFVTLHLSAQQNLYKEVNRQRTLHFRMPLKRDTTLEKQSQEWLIQMQRKYLGHMRHGSIRRKAKFEVLTNADDPIEAWMNSKSHRKAIMSRKVRRIGIAEVNGVYCARLN